MKCSTIDKSPILQLVKLVSGECKEPELLGQLAATVSHTKFFSGAGLFLYKYISPDIDKWAFYLKTIKISIQKSSREDDTLSC